VAAEVVGRAYGEDTLVAADLQHPLQETAALVVQEIFIPGAFYEFWMTTTMRRCGCFFDKSKM